MLGFSSFVLSSRRRKKEQERYHNTYFASQLIVRSTPDSISANVAHTTNNSLTHITEAETTTKDGVNYQICGRCCGAPNMAKIDAYSCWYCFYDQSSPNHNLKSLLHHKLSHNQPHDLILNLMHDLLPQQHYSPTLLSFHPRTHTYNLCKPSVESWHKCFSPCHCRQTKLDSTLHTLALTKCMLVMVSNSLDYLHTLNFP